jgi:hypothetical protein
MKRDVLKRAHRRSVPRVEGAFSYGGGSYHSRSAASLLTSTLLYANWTSLSSPFARLLFWAASESREDVGYVVQSELKAL